MSTIEVTKRTYSVTHSVSPHSVVINRTSSTPIGQSSLSISSRTGARAADEPFTEGNYALVATNGVSEVRSTREGERKELQDLNERFSSYLDRVRNLEIQNRKLADELEKLKSKWGKETSQIKAMYQAELDEARHTLDDAEKEKARLEIKVASLEEQIEELRVKLLIQQQEVAIYKDKALKQTQLIADYEREIQLLRKQLENLEGEHKKDLETISRLEGLLRQTREDLDIETLAHIDAENRRQTLEEAIEFLKSIHDQEMKELAALAHRDTSPESRDFWKNELAQAIREIESMYGEKMEDMRNDLETTYNLRLQELRTGSARLTAETSRGIDDNKDLRQAVTDLRDKINDLDARNNQLLREIEALRRAKEDRERQLEAENALLRDEANTLRHELDEVMRELQILLNTKLSLNLEIAAYRKLLEYEENRSVHRSILDERSTKVTEPAPEEDVGTFGRGEMSAKTRYERTAKGAISIVDCPPDGRFVRLENTGKKEENISGYKIQRNIDNRLNPPYVLDERFSAIQPGQKIALWAKDTKPKGAPATDIEILEFTWGIGSRVVTTLINVEGEERASLTQTTTYS